MSTMQQLDKSGLKFKKKRENSIPASEKQSCRWTLWVWGGT